MCSHHHSSLSSINIFQYMSTWGVGMGLEFYMAITLQRGAAVQQLMCHVSNSAHGVEMKINNI